MAKVSPSIVKAQEILDGNKCFNEYYIKRHLVNEYGLWEGSLLIFRGTAKELEMFVRGMSYGKVYC